MSGAVYRKRMLSKPPKGTRDILPSEVVKRRRILDVIRNELRLRGFFEIETPAIESIENLRSKQGGENESMLFEIQRRGLVRDEPIEPAQAVDLGLRYDLTLPLSRYYANNESLLPQVFRAFQTGPVWRAERPQKGRFRQFQQCDMDIIGDESVASEIEVLTTGWSVLRKLHLADNCIIVLNDRRLLDWMLDASQIDVQVRPRVLIALDKLDKIGVERVIEEMKRAAGVSDSSAQTLMRAIEELSGVNIGGIFDDAVKIDAFGQDVPLFDIRTIVERVRLIAPEARIEFSPSLVRGMGYYTGAIFEVKHAQFGSSICGGGRYDAMIGKMLGKMVPAVGFSFGFERLIDLVSFTDEEQENSVALAYTTPDEYLRALELRESLLDGSRRIGLTQAPRKPKRAFFERLVDEGFNFVVMPNSLAGSPEDAMEQMKPLQ